MDKVSYKMHGLPSVYLMELDIPIAFVDDCNNYLDELIKQENRISAASTLVGQIKRGEQLLMDHTDIRLAPFCHFLQ